MLQEVLDDMLVEAVKLGNLELVKELVEYGADIDCYYGTPLSEAVFERNVPIIRFLEALGVDKSIYLFGSLIYRRKCDDGDRLGMINLSEVKDIGGYFETMYKM